MQRLADLHGRVFSYLRLSVIEACNFRCAYCLPNGFKAKPSCGDSFEDLPLTPCEIENLVRAFAAMGFVKVRLSGGEPTLRKDILEIIERIVRIPGIKTCALTTNGFRLKKLAAGLRAAGLNALNVSVDSLDPLRFERITGSDLFERVFDGVREAQRVGIEKIKLNVVALKSFLAQDLPAFLDLLRDQDLSVRFIELMQTSDNREFFTKEHVPLAEMFSDLQSRGWRARGLEHCAGPAREFVHTEFVGRLGMIAPYSKDFCLGCNRLRVSSRGKLRLCLFGEGELPLRHLLQSPANSEELVATVIRLIKGKAQGHRLHQGISGDTRTLSAIGG